MEATPKKTTTKKKKVTETSGLIRPVTTTAMGGEGSTRRGKDDDDARAEEVSLLTSLLQRHEETLSRLGFAGAMGMASGYAAKRVGRAAACFVGVCFVSLQVNAIL